MVLSHDILNYSLAVCRTSSCCLFSYKAVLNIPTDSAGVFSVRSLLWPIEVINFLSVFFLPPCSQDHNQLEISEDVCNFAQSGTAKWPQVQSKTKISTFSQEAARKQAGVFIYLIHICFHKWEIWLYFIIIFFYKWTPASWHKFSVDVEHDS